MQAVTIDMKTWDARDAFNEYRKHVGPESSAEDRALLECYRMLMRGKRVLDLQRTMVAAGCRTDVPHLPKLAVCRADSARCEFTYEFNADYRVAPRFRSSLESARRMRDVWLLPGTFQVTAGDFAREFRNYSAQVPVIPPRIRPKTNLHRYLILWEAEWSRVPQKDPILLRPIGAGMYALVAQWDMTPLEAAIAAGRL